MVIDTENESPGSQSPGFANRLGCEFARQPLPITIRAAFSDYADRAEPAFDPIGQCLGGRDVPTRRSSVNGNSSPCTLNESATPRRSCHDLISSGIVGNSVFKFATAFVSVSSSPMSQPAAPGLSRCANRASRCTNRSVPVRGDDGIASKSLGRLSTDFREMIGFGKPEIEISEKRRLSQFPSAM